MGLANGIYESEDTTYPSEEENLLFEVNKINQEIKNLIEGLEKQNEKETDNKEV